MKHKTLLGLGALAAAAVLVAVSLQAPPAPSFPPLPERLLLDAGGGSGAGWVSYATIHNTVGTPIPRPTQDALYPGNYPIGIECQEYMTAVWGTQPSGGGACTEAPCSASNINWSLYQTCVNDAAARTVVYGDGVSAPQPVSLTIPARWLEEGGSGTSGAPYVANYAPSWMQNLNFTQNFERVPGIWYTGTNFDSASFVHRMQQMITEAGALFDDAENVVAVRINTGLVGETQPLKCMSGYNDTTCTNDTTLKQRHEQMVASCQSYLDFIDALARTGVAAFPHKNVYIEAGPGPCGSLAYNSNYEGRKYFWANPTTGWNVTNPVPVGYSYNAIAPDHPNADGNGADWDKYLFYRFAKTGAAYSTPMPVAPEYQRRANHSDLAGDAFAYNVWTAYAAAGLGAQGVFPFQGALGWQNNFSDLYWRTVDTRFGAQPNQAWLVFRDREHPTYLMDNQNIVNYGGFAGDYQAQLNILTPEAYPQYCNTYVKNYAATEVAARTNPTPVFKPCGNGANLLPTPKATVQATPGSDVASQFNILQRVGNRQARQLAANAQLGLAVADTWLKYGGVSNLTATLIYLDIGTDDLTVNIASASHTVDKKNTGLWQTETWTVTGATITNSLTVPGRGAAFVVITAGATSAVYLHSFDIQTTSAATATPTPTRTATATVTPSATPSPTVTVTPSATATAVYTAGVRLNEIGPAEGVDWTLDGFISPADRFFELVNWTAAPVDLGGWSVAVGAQTYAFPAGTLLTPHGHKVFLAEDTLFLPSAGTLTLLQGATVKSAVTYPAQTAGLCYGAHPDAAATWYSGLICTPGRAN